MKNFKEPEETDSSWQLKCPKTSEIGWFTNTIRPFQPKDGPKNIFLISARDTLSSEIQNKISTVFKH